MREERQTTTLQQLQLKIIGAHLSTTTSSAFCYQLHCGTFLYILFLDHSLRTVLPHKRTSIWIEMKLKLNLRNHLSCGSVTKEKPLCYDKRWAVLHSLTKTKLS